jgi:hypothetical protein
VPFAKPIAICPRLSRAANAEICHTVRIRESGGGTGKGGEGVLMVIVVSN